MVQIPPYVEIPKCATVIQDSPPPATGPPSQPSTPVKSVPTSPSSGSTTSPSSSRPNISSILLSHALQALPVPIPAQGQIRKPSDEVLTSAKDPLSLPIMSANFRRFIGKCQFVFWLQDRAEEVIMWRKGPMYTLSWMCAYTFFCFFPRLALLLPHIVLLHVLFSTYQARYPEAHNGTSVSIDDDTLAEIAPVVQPGEGTPDWFANLQAIQNLMGTISDAYDLVVPQLVHLTWTTPVTQPLFLLTLLSLFCLIPVIYLIPLRPLFLILGLAPFCVTHPYTLSAAPVIFQRLKPHLQRLLERTIDNDKLSQVHWQAQMDEVAVWENERWTAEKGWKHGNLNTGAGERRPWTMDMGGLSSERGVQGAPFDGSVRDLNFPLPTGWRFVETEDWSVDLLANWEHVPTDEEGWLYTDNAWHDPSSKPLDEWKSAGMTRSRKWIRRAYLAPR